MGKITFQGNPLTLTGHQVSVGDKVPDVELLANDLSPVKLSGYQGKTCVILTVPSLDTPVCDIETRKFNEKAAALGDKVAILAVSMDLPFAQARWCGAAGVKGVQTLSDHRSAELGKSFGVLIDGLRLLARSVFVVDKKGIIRYIEVVGELTNEPDYKAAIKAVKDLV